MQTVEYISKVEIPTGNIIEVAPDFFVRESRLRYEVTADGLNFLKGLARQYANDMNEWQVINAINACTDDCLEREKLMNEFEKLLS